jgi:hypothetical protein
MFGWFAPRCPLGIWEKTWTETRMRWLADRLGIERLLAAEVVLPTDEFFRGACGGTPDDAQHMLALLCGRMGINPATIELLVCPDEKMPDAAGLYERRRERSRIRVAQSQLTNSMYLLATLAHELSHELLLGGGLLDESVADHEWITDLLPVFLGIGVFAANATIHEQYWHEGQTSSWVIGKQGYLPSRMFGYAMALFCFVRQERNPPWVKHLRQDAATALTGGLRYLEKTGDTLFHPNTIHSPLTLLTPHEAVECLRAQNPSIRLATLWDMAEQGLATPECIPSLIVCLEDREPTLAPPAARLLAGFGPAASGAVPALLRCLDAAEDETRATAAEALGAFGTVPEDAIRHLASLLGDTSPVVVEAVAEALALLRQPLDHHSLQQLLAQLEKALVDCDDALAATLVSALHATTADPEACIREHLGRKDRELYREALRLLREQ